MKRSHHQSTVRALRRRLSDARARRLRTARRGSTLVVVMSLLALLSILGVTINLYTQQAAVSARYMSEGSKNVDDPELDPQVMMDFAVEQLILGAGPGYEQSALYGGRHSLLPNMFGRDLHPFSGRGINLIDTNADGIPEVDQDFDGMQDPSSSALLEINDSSAAHGGSVRNDYQDYDGNGNAFPAPDPDFTRPDINATWLGFNGYALDEDRRPVHVVIPSFHRPQYLRTGAMWPTVRDRGASSWDRSAATKEEVLRPHAAHEVDGFPGVPRFLTGGANPFPFGQSSSGVWNMRRDWAQNTPQTEGDWIFPDPAVNSRRFFFRAKTTGTTSTTQPNWNTVAEGADITPADGGVTWTAFKYAFYEFDADPNKDGVKESVYLDLGFPVQDFGGDLFVPLFAFHVVDGDSRVNLNFNGNAQGHANVNGGTAFGRKPGVSGSIHMLHESNHGLTPFEVNLAKVLTADPADIAPATQFDRLKDVFTDKNLTDHRELANAELFTLLKGLPHFDSNGNLEKRNEGRHGEAAVAENAYVNTPNQPLTFPRPGRSGVDDDNNSQFGEQIPNTFDDSRNYNVGDWVVARVTFAGNPFDLPLLCTAGGNGGDNQVMAVGSVSPGFRFRDGGGSNAEWMIFHHPFGTLSSHFGHPSDIRGMGSIHPPASLSLNVLAPTTAPKQPLRWLQHLNTPTAQGWNKWNLGTGGSPLINYQSYMTSAGERRINAYVDDPMETFTSGGTGDALFTPADSAFLLHSPTVQATVGTSSRIAALAKLNLVDDPDAVERRKRLTTISWDLRTRGVGPAPANRQWEQTAAGLFPPTFGSIDPEGTGDPIRPALRRWLNFRHGLNSAGQTPLQAITQRLASTNHVLKVNGARSRFQRLTAHPARIGPGPVDSSSTGLAAQEFQARLDRQQLARDIYVLLYTFCGGWDDVDPTSDANTVDSGTAPNAIREIYDDLQTEAMARFAVNLVDAMDGDDVITAFEFDRDLSDGWNLDDDPFSTTDSISLADDRGVVFGVEAQSLTLSETLVTQARRVRDGMMNPAQYTRTEHDDTEHRDWAYVELRNVSPHAIGFENEAWKIVVQEPASVAAASRNVRARHLVPTEGAVGGGGLFTIGSAGDDHLPNSEFRVDTTPMATGTFTRYVPPAAAGNLNLDLIEASDEDEFRLHDSSRPAMSVDAVDAIDPPLDTGNAGEGNLFDNTAATGKGEFLEFLDPNNVDNEIVEFVLMRRMHPYRIAPDHTGSAAQFDAQSRDNPWIEVDRTRTRVRVFGSDNTTDAWHLDPSSDAATSLTEVEAALPRVFSTERDEALVRLDFGPLGNDNVVDNSAHTATDLVRNTIGRTNKATDDNTGTAGTQSHFEVLQLHFDRDLTSPIDMFTIPLYGPHQLTSPRLGITNINRPIGALPNTAGADRFLRPHAPGAGGTNLQVGDADDPDRNPNTAGLDQPDTYKHDNRWYRLLGLVGTPTPMIDVTNPTAEQAQYRLPGRINWNTLSYPEVLAALLDEDTGFRPWSTTFNDGDSYPLKPNETPKQHGYLASSDAAENDSGDGALHRDWWVRFLEQRDGVDPVTMFRLPGTASGLPFRSPFFVTGRDHDPISPEISMLRGMGETAYNAEFLDRRLFELGTAQERYGATLRDDTDGQVIDLHTRHKVLSRAWNNSTTRSNALFVYVQVDFFEVTQHASGAFQIGGKKSGFPTHRGFFVVDRTLAYTTLKGGTGASGHFRPAGPTTGYSIKGIREDGFDFRDVIVHSELIE